jgi:hypothetical protein
MSGGQAPSSQIDGASGSGLASSTKEEKEALLDVADVFNTLAASIQVMETTIREQFVLPLQQVQSLVATTYANAERDASDARLELEAEGKKTAAQMSKKHKEAEKNSSDVAFGDLLKIQQSLKAVEKRFETAATLHLGTMLKIRHQRRTAVVGNVLRLLPDLGEAFRKAADRAEAMRPLSDNFYDCVLPKLGEEWEKETQMRDATVSRAVTESMHGTSKHLEGYLNVSTEGGKKGTFVRKYVVVADGRLAQYPSWAEHKMEQAVELLLFSAKAVVGDASAFELQSPLTSFWMEAPSEAKRNKWVAVVAENISQQLDAHKQTNKADQDEVKKKAVMEMVRGSCGNNVCADCDASEPTWISISYGIAICHQCSGVHRKIGSHLSKGALYPCSFVLLFRVYFFAF